MVSSGSGDVECSVGSIVWVRRRNGSWWPGKILGPEELSATHLMSPRSGTPVKLLGREDASVDWYNLEKSKRVKAFRCGEFDECIERAESSLGMPSKKREKYARREDAILHALELEKQMLQMEQRKLGIASDLKSRKFSDSAEKELIKSSESLPCDNGKFSNAKPHQLSTGLDLSLVGEKGGPLNSEKAEEGNQLRLEDDNTEAIPRMRGLRDFGLRTAPSKRKFSSVTSNGSHRPAADDHAQTTSYDGVSMGGTIHANIKNAVDKRRRLNEGLAEDVLAKRRDKCRPLVQVLQSSSKLQSSPSLLPDARTVSLSVSGEDQMGNIFRAKRSRCLYLPAEPSDSAGNSESTADQVRMSRPYTAEDNCPIRGSLMEANTSRFSEDEESDSSETEDMETDSDAETNELSDAAVHSEAELRALGGSDAEEKHERMSNEELDNAGVSKWQMKGKRNVRYLNRKLGVVDDGRRASEHSLNFNNRMDGFSNGHEADIIDDDYKMQMTRFGNRGNALASKASPFHQNRIGHDIIDWEDLAWEDQPYLKGYLEDAGECLDPVFAGRHNLGGRVRTSLIDVDLKVQASYKKEHVPIVSLMSKLDGKAIIGHPIQIEALREGSSQILLSEKNDLGNEATEGDATLPSVWRTARRTANYRVPRSHPSSALDSNESAEHHRLPGPGRKPPFKKLNAWSNSSKGSLASKDLPHIPRAPVDGRLAGKLSKKVSLSSSQKTRTLSSIVIQQKLSDPKHDSDGFPMDGLIQSDSGPTTVACIPVKLVFSRLYEAVGRPPSGVGNNEVIIKKNSETNPI